MRSRRRRAASCGQTPLPGASMFAYSVEARPHQARTSCRPSRPHSVTCTYPIVGGLLVGRPGGALALEQVNGDPVVLRSTLTEYVPRLAGTLYFQVQARLHSLISRRHFARLGRDAR